MPDHPLPAPALVVLVGPAGSGKSTWAAAHYRSSEVVSSDALRAVVGADEQDLEASADAFEVLDSIVAARLRRRLTTVVDTLGLDPARRRGWLALARAAGLPAVAVRLDTPAAEARARNAARDRRVPAAVLHRQLRRVAAAAAELAAEGWDVLHVVAADPARPPVVPPGPAAPDARDRGGRRHGGPEVVLQVSRFPWGSDPMAWLRDVARTADEVGLDGIALMDHLIQIPPVDRAWEPIPEPFVTLGALAALDTDLRLGTLCTPVTFRAPGLLAKAVATLDVLSGGRAFVGVGAGWWGREHAAYGLPFPGIGARQDALETTVETLRALWAPGTRPYVGARVSLPETTCYPRPVGSPQIIVGGGGERRTLRTAARWADACNLRSEPETLDRLVPVLHRHLAEAGRDRAEVAVTVLDLTVVGTDRADVDARLTRLRSRSRPAAQVAAPHAGTTAEHRERYRRLADRGVSTVFVALQDLDGPRDVEALAGLV